MADQNYTEIENPYNALLERSSVSSTSNVTLDPNTSSTNLNSTTTNSSSGSNGNVETMPVKSDGSSGDVWINTFIRSMNWQPKKVGFYIDGQTGYAEFTNVYVSGNIQALTGLIGGFTIGATALYAGTGVTRIQLDTTQGIFLGADTFGSSPFRVALSGALTATNATITGSITASTGSIGGWVITSTAIKDVAGVVGLSSIVTGGDDIRFFAGNTIPSSAPFYVTEGGVLVATSATISGAITATSGSIGSFTIGTYLYTGTKTAYNDTNAGVHVGSDGIGIGNNVFTVSNLGALVATSAAITGAITATAGSIGSFTIGTYLYTGTKIAYNDANAGVHIGSDGIGIGNNIFTVSAAGALVATSATITGSITATTGAIGGFVIGATTVSSTGLILTSGTSASLAFGSTPPTTPALGTGIYLDKTGLFGLNANTQNFKIDATNGYITAIAGTVGGNVLAPTSIGSTNFVSGLLGKGWNISNTGTAEFQNVTVRGIIDTAVFQKDMISAVGGYLLVSPSDVLGADMLPRNTSTLTTRTITFPNNSVVRIKDGVSDEWMLVVSSVGFVHTVTRDLAGSYAPTTIPIWTTGTAVASMGVGTGTKTGFVSIDTASANSPFIDIYGRNSNSYLDYSLHGRFGWLKGITDTDVGLATTDVWGLYTDNAYIKGVVVAKTGYIGGTTGWVISSNYIKDVAGVTGLSSVVTGGDDIRFWAGNSTPASAPFYVTESGALVATSATISGAITSTSGAIGGWVVNSNSIKDVAGLVGMSSAVTVGDDIRFFAGNVTPTSAPFYVTESGVLVATSATIAGIITANSGYIGGTSGWVISAGYIKDVAGVTGLSSVVTGGDDIRFWAGNVTPASAPFYVTESGALVATSATISGSITATTGAIGGFTIGSDYIRDAANSFGLASTVTGGDDTRFWAGSTFANRATAPFNLSESGSLFTKKLSVNNYVDCLDGSVTYSGSWTDIASNTSLHNHYKSSSTVGDYFEITFVGTDIGLVIGLGGNRGKVDIYIDTVFNSTLDLYANPNARSIVYQKNGLTNASHVLRGVVATKNGSATANIVPLSGYSLSPNKGIFVESISSFLYFVTYSGTTDANGYLGFGPTPPTGYSVINICGVSLTTAVMSDATLTDPKLASDNGNVYLYNGAALTSYSVNVTMLLSSY